MPERYTKIVIFIVLMKSSRYPSLGSIQPLQRCEIQPRDLLRMLKQPKSNIVASGSKLADRDGFSTYCASSHGFDNDHASSRVHYTKPIKLITSIKRKESAEVDSPQLSNSVAQLGYLIQNESFNFHVENQDQGYSAHLPQSNGDNGDDSWIDLEHVKADIELQSIESKYTKKESHLSILDHSW